ncbi:MAG: hypothetical protein IJF75_01300 [Clostridia bacterium]|nr:hypothetical protein [Clostridia bacterium]
MMSDFSKQYIRELQELVKRVEKLENERKNVSASELIFSFSESESARSFTKSLEFTSNQEQTLNFNISGKISSNSERAQIIVYLDGIKLRSVYTQNGEFSFVCQSAVDKGEHLLEINLLYYLDFTLDSLDVRFVGAVSYKKYKTELQTLNFSDESIIVFRCDDLVTVYSYDGENLEKQLKFNAKSVGISGYNNDFAIAYLDEEKCLRLKIFNRKFEVLSEIFLDSDVATVTGSKAFDGFRFYGIKGSRAFIYDIDENLNFVKSRLNSTVKKVESSPNVENAIILTDFSGNVRLVI